MRGITGIFTDNVVTAREKEMLVHQSKPRGIVKNNAHDSQTERCPNDFVKLNHIKLKLKMKRKYKKRNQKLILRF